MIPRPALRYFGGKWKLAPWIISHMPPHTTYVEPFGGAMSVMLRKSPAFINVYNDLSDLVVNFFRVLRDQPDALIHAIQLTPYSRTEYLQAQVLTDDPLEQARRFYVWCWQGRGRGGIVETGGWAFQKSKTRTQTDVNDWCKTDYLYETARFIRDNVYIEHSPAEKVIRLFDTPETLFYVDPPYVHSARGDRWGTSAYNHEMTDDDHRALAEQLQNVKGYVMITGYECELYDDLYHGWTKDHRKHFTDSKKRVTEVLYMNFAPPLRLF